MANYQILFCTVQPTSHVIIVLNNYAVTLIYANKLTIGHYAYN